MEHDTLGIRFIPNPNPTATIATSSLYRRRWWLPLIGPTASCIVDLFCDSDRGNEWATYHVDNICTRVGIGRPQSQRRLISSLDRLVRFKLAYFDVEPHHPDSPICLSVYAHVHPVPTRLSRQWPKPVQQLHSEALAATAQRQVS